LNLTASDSSFPFFGLEIAGIKTKLVFLDNAVYSFVTVFPRALTASLMEPHWHGNKQIHGKPLKKLWRATISQS
jgi:hypothetical protein